MKPKPEDIRHLKRRLSEFMTPEEIDNLSEGELINIFEEGLLENEEDRPKLAREDVFDMVKIGLDFFKDRNDKEGYLFFSGELKDAICSLNEDQLKMLNELPYGLAGLHPEVKQCLVTKKDLPASILKILK